MLAQVFRLKQGESPKGHGPQLPFPSALALGSLGERTGKQRPGKRDRQLLVLQGREELLKMGEGLTVDRAQSP